MIVRPATREDIEAFSSVPNKPSLLAVVGEIDGKIVGLAGFAFTNGRWVAFCDLEPEARSYKTTIARAAIRMFRKAKEKGVRFIYAEANPQEPGAVRWLTSLGFEIDPRSSHLYRWKA